MAQKMLFIVPDLEFGFGSKESFVSRLHLSPLTLNVKQLLVMARVINKALLQVVLIFLPMLPFNIADALNCMLALDIAGAVLGWRRFDHFGHLGGEPLFPTPSQKKVIPPHQKISRMGVCRLMVACSLFYACIWTSKC